MDDSYKKVLTFLHEAEKLKSTMRHNWTTSSRQEDSAEHAWRAALFFIILQKVFGFEIDEYKVVSMLLIHDLPEVTYGDIPGFVKTTDPKAHAKHKLREKKAAKQLYHRLPKKIQTYFTHLQEEFENGESTEAKMAQALEKIESQLQHLESGPKYWSDEEKGEHMLHYPDGAIARLNNAHVKKIWEIIYQQIYAVTYPEK